MRVLKLGKNLYARGRTWSEVLIIANEVSKLVNKDLISDDSSAKIGNLVIKLKRFQPEKQKMMLQLDLVEKTPKTKLTKDIFVKLLKRKVLK